MTSRVFRVVLGASIGTLLAILTMHLAKHLGALMP